MNSTLIDSIKSVLSYVSGDEAEHYLELAQSGEVGLEGHVWVALAELYRAIGHEGTTKELAQRASTGNLKAEMQLK